MKNGVTGQGYPRDHQPAVQPASKGLGYTGPIEVGMAFLWEPQKPTAFERVVVTGIDNRCDDGRMIGAKAASGPGAFNPEHWNTEERFREAVVLDPSLPPGVKVRLDTGDTPVAISQAMLDADRADHPNPVRHRCRPFDPLLLEVAAFLRMQQVAPFRTSASREVVDLLEKIGGRLAAPMPAEGTVGELIADLQKLPADAPVRHQNRPWVDLVAVEVSQAADGMVIISGGI